MSWAGQPKTFAPGFARAGAAPDPARLRQAGGAANPRAGKEALERASYLGEMPSLNQDQHPPPLSYAQMIRQVRSKYDLGLRLVESAKHIGIKPTARLYGASPQTVRKWLRRYQAQKRSGLADRSHAPLTCPHKTPKHLEQRVIAAREQTGFGAARLRAEFELPVSVGAIARILRHAGLVRPRKRKHTTKQDLRAVKATWAVFSKLCHDTKDLDDIPYYWPQAKALGLPVIQYTAREVRTGLTFADYAQQRSASLACVFAERVMAHLTACGVPLDEVGFQSDNGSEYAGGKDRRGVAHGFKPTVEARGVNHTFIPPSAHTYQSDVETVHRLCEDEFFDRPDPSGPAAPTSRERPKAIGSTSMSLALTAPKTTARSCTWCATSHPRSIRASQSGAPSSSRITCISCCRRKSSA